MPIAKELLKLLVCPICHGELRLAADSTGVDCPKCSVRFPIRDDIAMLVIEEARRLDASGNAVSSN